LARLVHNLLSAGRFAGARQLVEEAREAADGTADVGATFTLDLAEGGLDTPRATSSGLLPGSRLRCAEE
jgi:hypothetical protein